MWHVKNAACYAATANTRRRRQQAGQKRGKRGKGVGEAMKLVSTHSEQSVGRWECQAMLGGCQEDADADEDADANASP